MTKNLVAAVIQHPCHADYTDNINTTITLIQSAAQQGAQLAILPELHSHLYFCQTEAIASFALAEPLNGPTFQRFSSLAKELDIVIICSIFEKRAVGLYHNTALVIDTDGKIAGYYRKMHIPDDPGYHEKYYFTSGDLGFTPINCSLGCLGVMVCWDQWYPEAARLMAMSGAEILIYPTAIGWDLTDSHSEQQRQLEAWITIQRSHAIANHIPVLSANRIGFEAHPDIPQQGIQFWGNSFITDGQGQILAQASSSKAQVLLATLTLSDTEKLRQVWPYFRDRRIDAYTDLTKRYCD